jgi:hypothetical protein
MSDELLKGKVLKLFIKEHLGHKMPTFRVKFPNGTIKDYGRGDVVDPDFGKLTSKQMKAHLNKPFYGLKKGDTIYITTQSQELW